MEQTDIFGHRRSSKRQTCFLIGGYLLLDKEPFVAKYHDISLEGVGVLTQEPLPVNIQVKVALNTKKEGLLLTNGRVCWCAKVQDGWRSGISFNRKLSFELTALA